MSGGGHDSFAWRSRGGIPHADQGAAAARTADGAARKGATASRAPVVPGTAVAFRGHPAVGIAVSGSPDWSETTG